MRHKNKPTPDLLQAAIDIRDDLLERAEMDRGVKVVECGNGVWFRFNQAIDDAIARAKGGE